MIFPILAYGDPVLRKKGKAVEKKDTSIEGIIDNMFKTMYSAKGVGLAAPQVGLGLRLFIVDSKELIKSEYSDNEESVEKPIKKVFINPEIVKRSDDEEVFTEGCLSIPEIREPIIRPENILIRYYDEHFKLQEDKLDGLNARVVQHEFDHIEGILFVDHLKPLKKRLLKKKLDEISKGQVQVKYQMQFPLKKKSK